ncbi:hypothetical protein L1987_56677 [Smallanthus sonchifolius]|uniref:Uncharacterized protein n=1 Tax=Smallanthus sonchifolius TaxID=185202 RepID=A0ACB9ED28_9ASTR|nr:hypothetical protein L1987_56677 [Smallanthus sonchifolius]
MLHHSPCLRFESITTAMMESSILFLLPSRYLLAHCVKYDNEFVMRPTISTCYASINAVASSYCCRARTKREQKTKCKFATILQV